MKMTLKSTITTGALLLGFGVAASAQSTLVAGWDFSQYSSPGGFSSTDGENLTGSLNANYSGFPVNDGNGFVTSGPNFVGAAQFGTLHYDGQFGSTAFSLNPSDLRPQGTVDMTVGASVGGTTLGAKGNRNVLKDQGQTYQNAYSLGFNESANGKSFVFAISLTEDAAFQQGSDWVFQFGGLVGPSDDDGSSIVDWEYSTDANEWFDSNPSNLTDSESLYSVDLSGVDSASELFVRGTFSGIDGVSYIDNVSVSAVPEPSTFGAIFGILALGFAAVRRRLNK